ncbi:MAG: polysaccharide deacetylase family protein [Chloroflexota bacterium]|nr:polysaccharide deacetylase family protein [Dehalococcoidia bacterium]MDW8253805.1 polysaccharide deacetylase family protein [Chloroflexota bacterium]
MEPHYRYRPVSSRPPFRWPGGNHLAVVLTVTLESWDLVKPAGAAGYAGGPSILPDPLPADIPDWPNYTWREYGMRVGFWRVLEVLEQYGVRGSAALGLQVPERYPAMFEAALEAGWELNAHGYDQGTPLTAFARDPDAERRYLEEVVARYLAAVGTRPLGWLSPSARFTAHTVRFLAELGFLYHGDYLNDDEPYLIEVSGRRLVAIPYSFEVNDYTAFFRRNFTTAEWSSLLRETFDFLLDEARRTGSGKLMNVGLHPHVIGAPFRIRSLAQFLAYAREQPGVFFPTREEIARITLDQAERIGIS